MGVLVMAGILMVVSHERKFQVPHVMYHCLAIIMGLVVYLDYSYIKQRLIEQTQEVDFEL